MVGTLTPWKLAKSTNQAFLFTPWNQLTEGSWWERGKEEVEGPCPCAVLLSAASATGPLAQHSAQASPVLREPFLVSPLSVRSAPALSEPTAPPQVTPPQWGLPT